MLDTAPITCVFTQRGHDAFIKESAAGDKVMSLNRIRTHTYEGDCKFLDDG